MRSAMLVAVVAALLLCTASATDLVQFAEPESHEVPLQWQEEPLTEDRTVTFRVALQQRNMDVLERMVLEEIANPDSPKFGKHLNTEALRELTGASAEAHQEVSLWLATYGGVGAKQVGDTYTLTLPVMKAARMFNTTFVALVNPSTKQRAVRAGSLYIPRTVVPHVSAVYGLRGLPLPPRDLKIRSKVQAPLDVAVTPKTIWTRYNVSGVTPSGSANIRQAVGEFQGQLYNAADLNTFFNVFVPNAKSGDNVVYKYVGDKGSGQGVEALLDIEYIMGVSPGIKTEFWEYKNYDFCSDLKTFTNDLVTGSDQPSVFSISYGWQGSLSRIGCQTSEVQDIDGDLLKLAAKGMTFSISSGDSGSGESAYEADETAKDALEPATCVSWRQTGGCSPDGPREPQNDKSCSYTIDSGWSGYCDCGSAGKKGGVGCGHGTFTCNDICAGQPVPPPPPRPVKPLYASWPASSPWVTAVGATRFINQNANAGEMASDQFGSGGGFMSTNGFTQPRWQKTAVATFFANAIPSGLPPKGSYDPSGRGTPDVSALGQNYQVVVGGRVGGVGGTSASAPAFAGLISLINDARMQKGKSPLGFLNLWLYANPGLFYDVTVGTNKIGRSGYRLLEGWDCTKGWDPATGLGTPNFDKLLASALNLP